VNQTRENPLYNLILNIILPILILYKGPQVFEQPIFRSLFPIEHTSLYSLILALSFPFIYGLTDYILKKKFNVISLISLIGILLTGGLALFQVEGIYFAIKEALVPLVIGVIVAASILYKKPLISLMLSAVFKQDLIDHNLTKHNKEKDFQKVLNKTTLWLAGSFFISAILNFIIGMLVFKKIDPNITEQARAQILNAQIADMTWMGYVFISLPLSVIMIFILYDILTNLKKMTGLDWKCFLKQQ